MNANSAILVTGASGFVGSAVAARLVRDGRVVHAAVRSAAQAVPPSVRAIEIGDIAATRWAAILPDIAAVVHCAARAHVLDEREADPLAEYRRINRDATLSLAAEAAACGVRRFVFLSSIGVNGSETGGMPFRHDDPPHPHSPYALAKWEAEQGLARIAAETGMDVVIVRSPLVLGPAAKGNLGTLARLVRKGLPLPLGSVTRNRRDLVSLSTLADLMAAVLDHPAAAGQTFLVSDGAPLSTRAIAERVAALENARARFLPVPPLALRLALQALGRGGLASQLLGNLEVDIAHTRRTLGWDPVAARAG